MEPVTSQGKAVNCHTLVHFDLLSVLLPLHQVHSDVCCPLSCHMCSFTDGFTSIGIAMTWNMLKCDGMSYLHCWNHIYRYGCRVDHSEIRWKLIDARPCCSFSHLSTAHFPSCSAVPHWLSISMWHMGLSSSVDLDKWPLRGRDIGEKASAFLIFLRHGVSAGLIRD